MMRAKAATSMLDVVVIGAGPAGSTAGHLLAAQGHAVLVVDKDDFPRFHIGESLLPCGLPVFARLGLDLAAGPYVRKRGAEFIDERSGAFAFYDFADALPGAPRHAYQVERATFDLELLRLAEAAGARVELRKRVREVGLETDRVVVHTDGGTLQARFVVDASGQDALLGRRARSLHPLRNLGRAAAFAHVDGLDEQVASELTRDGNIKVLIRTDGWMWVIPLASRRLSVGLVSRTHALDADSLDDALADSPLSSRLCAHGTRGPTRVARNWSYENRASHGPRFACVGDAACFLDPVFSSGVSLALLGAERLAELLSPALHAGLEADPRSFAGYAEHMQTAYSSVGALVHSFYHTGLVPNLFFAPRPDPELRSGLISLLAGDLWRSDNRFQSMLTASDRRRIV